MAELKLGSARFVCVEYPGIVENDEKMLQTLGNETEISKTYRTAHKHLALRWRPDDFYSKATYGEKHATTNLLMKVKRRTRKRRNPDGTFTEDVKYVTEVLGVIGTTYKFDGLLDFQYLPIIKQPDDTYKSLVPALFFDNSLPSHTCLDKKDTPLFIPPIMFSRFVSCGQYMYRPDKQKNPSLPESEMAGINRKKRYHRNRFSAFDDPVPMEPLEAAVLEIKPLICQKDLEIVSSAFKKRPVWSKNALTGSCKISENRVKQTLPLVAYYVTSGPWKNLWIRYGYDPRKLPESKIYQSIDFRLTSLIAQGDRDDPIANKRSYTRREGPVARLSLNKSYQLQQKLLVDPQQQQAATEKEADSTDHPCIFRPTELPQFKMMLYQLCDIYCERVQKLVHLNDGKEVSCTEVDGWCGKNIIRRIVYIMKETVRSLLKEQGHDNLSRKNSLKIQREQNSGSESDNSELNELDKEMIDYMSEGS